MVYSDILLNYALLVCTWRHGGHVGGQEQQHLSPLGTKRHFHVNSSRKNSTVLTTNMAALSRGCKQNIFHYEVRSYATPQSLFFGHQHGRRDVTWKRSLEARPSVPVWWFSVVFTVRDLKSPPWNIVFGFWILRPPFKDSPLSVK